MFIFKLYKYMQIRIFHIKALFGHNPSIPGIVKQILMEIPNLIGIRFIYLAKTFIFNCFPDGFAIYFGLKCQFDWIYNVFVKL